MTYRLDKQLPIFKARRSQDDMNLRFHFCRSSWGHFFSGLFDHPGVLSKPILLFCGLLVLLHDLVSHSLHLELRLPALIIVLYEALTLVTFEVHVARDRVCLKTQILAAGCVENLSLSPGEIDRV